MSFRNLPAKILRRLMLHRIIGVTSEVYACSTLTFSQFGEDIALMGLLKAKERKGFYVDVGAYDPVYLSNTYSLYRCGWRGLAIDGSTRPSERFQRIRPRDTFACAVIGSPREDVKFVDFENGAFSGLQDAVYGEGEAVRGRGSTKRVRVQSLAAILEENRVGDVDLFDVDCEGSDLEVLESNDWDRWTPRVVAVEANSTNREAISALLESHGLRSVMQLGLTSIYARAK